MKIFLDELVQNNTTDHETTNVLLNKNIYSWSILFQDIHKSNLQ